MKIYKVQITQGDVTEAFLIVIPELRICRMSTVPVRPFESMEIRPDTLAYARVMRRAARWCERNRWNIYDNRVEVLL